MSNSLNPVFGEWYTDKQLGNGTDGKVFSIYKENYNGEREYSILKIIRLSENRNERKLFEYEGSEIKADNEDAYYDNIIARIKENIETVKKSNASRFIIGYQDIELRKASDGKGRLILLRLERGKSLSELTKELSFTLEEVIRLGINICNGLVKCRSFGYIYPNLKPENIIFTEDGGCKLGDFGTFSCLEPSKTSVSYKRTQYYMAPEFIKSGNINCTADTYSLGLILYMLTNRNRLPFTEPYPQKLSINSLNEATGRRLTAEEFEKPLLASDELWSIIRKACAFNPNKRYFSPEHMLSDLKSVLENKPFDEPKYDDVYSKMPTLNDDDAELVIPEIEASENTVAVQQTPVLSIKEEIQIPGVDPVYNKRRTNGQTARRRVINYDNIPDIRKQPAPAKPSPKKLIITACVALALILLLIISLSVRGSAISTEQLTAMIPVFNEYYGGVTLWQLIW